MKQSVLLIAILIAMSFLGAQDRYTADISYYDPLATQYYTQCPRAIAAGTYTVLGTRFTPLYPVSRLNGFNIMCYMSSGAVNSIKVEVFDVDEVTGLPTGMFPRASVTKPFADITWAAWNFFDFTEANLSFAAGEEFFMTFSVTNGVPGSIWAGPLLTLLASPAHSYRYFTSGTQTGWVGYSGEFEFVANVEYDAPFHDVSAKSLWFNGDLLLPQGQQISYAGDIENTGDQTENNIPVTLEISDITYPNRNVVYSNTQYVTSLPAGNEFHIDTFPAYTFNTPGEYIVTLRTELPSDMLPGNNQIFLEQQVVVLPTTLSYDDGTADGAWAPNVGGNYFANEFECPYGPVIVTDLHYYIWPNTWPVPGSTSMGIAVFDDDGLDGDGNPGAPGTQLYYAEVLCTQGAWNNYSLIGSDVIVDDGHFFVAWKSLADYPSCPGLAVDGNPPYSAWKVSWQNVGGVWNQEYPEFEMDWMIRASVDYIEFWSPEDLVISHSGNDILLDWADVPATNYYEVYHGSTPGTVNSRIATDINTSHFTHSNALSQGKGFYKVAASTQEMRRGNGMVIVENKAAARMKPQSVIAAKVNLAE